MQTLAYVWTTLALTSVACGGSAPNAQGPTVDGGAAVASAALAEDLRFLREEEKLARDLYLRLHQRFGLMQHQNIAQSEGTHTAAVRTQLLRLGVPDPVSDDTQGAFTNATLAALYNQLVAEGEQSELAALRVSATVEDLDIRDIQMMRGRTSDAFVRALYDSLECGSRNHLRAFHGQIVQRGGTYAAQHITAAELQAIVSGAHESCAAAP